MNSTSPVSFDLAWVAESLRFEPAKPKLNDEVAIEVILRNSGRQPAGGFAVRVFEDVNGDSSLTDDEEIQSPLVITETLSAEAVREVTFHWVPASPGFHSVFARVDYALDQRPANNLASGRLGVGFPERTLVINEIMYSPLSGQPEWVELYNRSTAAVDVEAWGVADSDSASFTIITGKSLSIPTRGFVVVAADSSLLNRYGPLNCPLLVPRKKLPSLNNDLDRVALFDLNGNLIDQVVYRSTWGGDTGVSLERINPDIASSDSSNWSSCVFALGGTPGERNSIYTEAVPAKADLEIAPSPFSPDSDGFEDFTIIRYQLPLSAAAVNIKIYDVRGRLVRMLFNNEPSGASRSVVWDGKGDDGQPLRVGIYIVYLEALNARQGVLKTLKKTVVLAGKL